MEPKTHLEIIFSRCRRDHPLIQELYRMAAALSAHGTDDPPVPAPESTTDAGSPEAETHSPTPPESQPNLEHLITTDLELVSLPDIFFQIDQVINDPRSSARDIAGIISKDPNISAQLLKLVNSAFFGYTQRIDTISRAVTILGNRQISELILGTSVVALFREIPASRMNMNLFWKHSIACGICARMIAGFRNFPNTERFFVAGLLHDLGKLIIFKTLPRESNKVLCRVQEGRDFYYQTERDFFGFDHAQIGRILAQRWQLPEMLEQAIGGHHPPFPFPPSAEATLVFIADNLANALSFGSSGERRIAPELVEAADYLSLPTGIWENLIPLVCRQVQETYHLFYPPE